MRHVLALLCGLLTAGFLLGAPARPSGREILILNRGEEPIYRIAVGHAKRSVWSGDLLPFNDVIGVGEGKAVTIPIAGQCISDLRANYGDGDTADLTAVDLCSVSSVRFDH
ncbi:MAG: hypothetical protein NVS9B12_14610 [Vulcanimicrobiaceae bacterium]